MARLKKGRTASRGWGSLRYSYKVMCGANVLETWYHGRGRDGYIATTESGSKTFATKREAILWLREQAAKIPCGR